ncbi:hypothetical protein HD554DRAFT_2174527 [Boletus coccyginus]|nr:hypothetical protein HD554DRAFT_2174527 [Boletus coccyginus]
MSSLKPDTYEILALSSGDRAVGVVGPEPVILPYQIVHVGLPDNKWIVGGSGIDALHLKGYPFTGVKDGRVIVSVRREDAREWIIIAIGPDEYIIQLADEPGQGWTVSPENSIHPEVISSPFYLAVL